MINRAKTITLNNIFDPTSRYKWGVCQQPTPCDELSQMLSIAGSHVLGHIFILMNKCSNNLVYSIPVLDKTLSIRSSIVGS